jgi:predicted TIM-barrel fold metal-dependent hydrolase
MPEIKLSEKLGAELHLVYVGHMPGVLLLTDEHLDDIRTHNDYSADICSADPERLLGFCSLNPAPELAGGDLGRAVDLMIEEANRCYHELGLRGVGEVVPAHWYANDSQVLNGWCEL